MDRKEVTFLEAMQWFDKLSGVEKDLARLLMLTVQRDYGFYFDRAIAIVCESYLDAKENQRVKREEKDSLEMSEETIAALRRELNGKKGN